MGKSLEQGLQQGLSPGALVAVRAYEVEGKALLVIEVPAGKDLPYAFENVIYLRTGQTTRKADVETIRDMVLRKQVEPERWERRFSSRYERIWTSMRFGPPKVTASGRFRFGSDSPTAILEDLSVSGSRLTNGGDVLWNNPAAILGQGSAAVFRTDKTATHAG